MMSHDTENVIKRVFSYSVITCPDALHIHRPDTDHTAIELTCPDKSTMILTYVPVSTELTQAMLKIESTATRAVNVYPRLVEQNSGIYRNIKTSIVCLAGCLFVASSQSLGKNLTTLVHGTCLNPIKQKYEVALLSHIHKDCYLASQVITRFIPPSRREMADVSKRK